MDANTKHFNKYLKKSGVLAALTNAFGKLFVLKDDERPENSVWFIQLHLMKEFEDFPNCAEYHRLKQELEENIQELQEKKKNEKKILKARTRNVGYDSGDLTNLFGSEKNIPELQEEKKNEKKILKARTRNVGYDSGDLTNLFGSENEQGNTKPESNKTTLPKSESKVRLKSRGDGYASKNVDDQKQNDNPKKLKKTDLKSKANSTEVALAKLESKHNDESRGNTNSDGNTSKNVDDQKQNDNPKKLKKTDLKSKANSTEVALAKSEADMLNLN